MSCATAPPPTSPSDQLDAIGQAFFASFDKEGGFAFGVACVLASFVILLLLVRWVRRERGREQCEQRSLDARHEIAVSCADANPEARQWVRVAAHLPMTLQRTDRHHRVWYERCETQDVSGGGLSFLFHSSLAPGLPLAFTLDLGDGCPLPLHGVVVRAEHAPDPRAPSLVAARLGPTTPAEREQVIRWVAQEELRDLARSRRGRICPVCERPLAGDAGDMHSTCDGRLAPHVASMKPVTACEQPPARARHPRPCP